jgi:hypothetical protein
MELNNSTLLYTSMQDVLEFEGIHNSDTLDHVSFILLLVENYLLIAVTSIKSSANGTVFIIIAS